MYFVCAPAFPRRCFTLNVIENIRRQYPKMTKKQKEISDFMLADPERMSFITLKQLSVSLHVSEMTVLNTCACLGYAGFNDMKSDFRQYLLSRRHKQPENGASLVHPPLSLAGLHSPEGLLVQICQEELAMISAFCSQFYPDPYLHAARLILEKQRIVLCGRGISAQLMEYMATRLATFGILAVCVNTELSDTVHAIRPLVGEDTLVIAFSFPEYHSMTTTLVQYAAQKGAAVLGITDTLRADICPCCTQTLLCPTNTRLFLNTLSAAMLLINLLASAVHIEKSGREPDPAAVRSPSPLSDSKPHPGSHPGL